MTDLEHAYRDLLYEIRDHCDDHEDFDYPTLKVIGKMIRSGMKKIRETPDPLLTGPPPKDTNEPNSCALNEH